MTRKEKLDQLIEIRDAIRLGRYDPGQYHPEDYRYFQGKIDGLQESAALVEAAAVEIAELRKQLASLREVIAGPMSDANKR